MKNSSCEGYKGHKKEKILEDENNQESVEE
jgi:hypothetical protein